jgi:hypothetical protein
MQMANNRLISNSRGDILWHQVIRDRDNASLKERDVPVGSDADRAVEEFANFCVATGGDVYSSIGIATDEINAQSRDLIQQVYLADREDEINNYEPILDTAVLVFKALDRYYVRHCVLKTG